LPWKQLECQTSAAKYVGSSLTQKVVFDLFKNVFACLALFFISSAALAIDVNNPTPLFRMGVIGDSDSHSYQDDHTFGSSQARGAAYRRGTFQWTEILAKSGQIDLGTWGVWGTKGRIAQLQDFFNLSSRAPQKQDFENNFAASGARCENLMEGRLRQTPRLLELMDRSPGAWRTGVVVIRMGTNNFGDMNSLGKLAVDSRDAGVMQEIQRCIAKIEETMAMIHAKHPSVRFVLVGIFNNAEIAAFSDKWSGPNELNNIAAGLDVFDNGLKTLAKKFPATVFFDDRAWFRQYWGSRYPQYQAAPRSYKSPSGFEVTNSIGDHPGNLALTDGHAGLVANALWSRNLQLLMNQSLGTQLRVISDVEIRALYDNAVRVGRESKP
jgi:hypothetical protein